MVSKNEDTAFLAGELRSRGYAPAAEISKKLRVPKETLKSWAGRGVRSTRLAQDLWLHVGEAEKRAEGFAERQAAATAMRNGDPTLLHAMLARKREEKFRADNGAPPVEDMVRRVVREELAALDLARTVRDAVSAALREEFSK